LLLSILGCALFQLTQPRFSAGQTVAMLGVLGLATWTISSRKVRNALDARLAALRAAWGGRFPRLAANARWLVQWGANGSVLILAALTAAWALWFTPLDRIASNGTGDILYHTTFVGGAAQALSEGQIPIREAPRFSANPPLPEIHRYPLYQFYSNWPYFSGGLLVHLGLTSYHALLAVVFLSYLLGFGGMCRLARLLGASRGAALVGAVAYTLSPYHLVVWYARSAAPETVALGFVPWVFFFTLHTYQRRGFLSLALASLFWVLLILSHNIVHLWSLTFVGAFSLVAVASGFGAGKPERFWLRPVAAYGLAALACAWFILPIAKFGNYFQAAVMFSKGMAHMTIPSLATLLSALPKGLDGFPNGAGLYLKPQIGFPLLLGMAAYVYQRRWKSFSDPVVVAFTLSIICILNFMGIYPYLGVLGRIVQFPYRLVIFSILFAALGTSLAFDRLQLPWRGACVLGFALVCAAWFKPYQHCISLPMTPAQTDQLSKRTGVVLQWGWPYDLDGNASRFEPDLQMAGGTHKVYDNGVEIQSEGQLPETVGISWNRLTTLEIRGLDAPALVKLPLMYYPGLHKITVNGQEARYGHQGNRIALMFPHGGDFTIRHQFVGLWWANLLSLCAWIVLACMAYLGLRPEGQRRAQDVLVWPRSSDHSFGRTRMLPSHGRGACTETSLVPMPSRFWGDNENSHMNPKSLSLIFLVFNEQGTLRSVIEEAAQFCREGGLDWEIVIVDDGSRDTSNAIAKELVAAEPRIRLVVHPENRGMGAGMRTGIANAQKDYLLFLSSDGQAPVRELEKFFPHLAKANIVLSTYEIRRSSVVREVLSFGMRALMRVAAGIRFSLDGLYIFPTALARELAPLIPVNTFFFSFELIDRAMAAGARIATTTMVYKPRQEGSSKVANWKQIKRVADEIITYAIRKRLGRP
jgi:hypothetical protein